MTSAIRRDTQSARRQMVAADILKYERASGEVVSIERYGRTVFVFIDGEEVCYYSMISGSEAELTRRAEIIAECYRREDERIERELLL